MAHEGETRAGVIYGFLGTFFPLATIAVGLRLYSRLKYSYIGIDDILNWLAYLLFIGLVIATAFATRYGLGKPIADIPIENSINFQKSGFSSQVLYPPALGLVKASAVLLLVRILPVVHSWKTPLRIFAGFIAVTESALLVCLFLQCRPLAYYWDKRIEDGSCFNQMAFYYADASLNMIIDFGILAAPCLIFRDLNVPRKQKYAVTALCSAGVFTLIASVVRLPYLHDLNQPGSDPTWQVVDIVIWSTAELGSAIMLSSVPAIKPVWVHAIEHCRRKMGVGGNSQDTPPSAGTGRTGLLKQISVVPHPLSPRRISGGQGRDSYIHLNDNPGVMGRNHLDNDDHFTIDSRDRNEILQ